MEDRKQRVKVRLMGVLREDNETTGEVIVKQSNRPTKDSKGEPS